MCREATQPGSLLCGQGIQSVVLAMEYFNAKSPSVHFVPVVLREGQSLNSALEGEDGQRISAIVAGAHTSAPSYLSALSINARIPVFSLAYEKMFAFSDDLFFRPRPRSGGVELGQLAKRQGVSSYAVVYNRKGATHMEEFMEDFEEGIGRAPSKEAVLGYNPDMWQGALGGIGDGVEGIVMALPDWFAAVVLGKLRSLYPFIPVYLSSAALSHRTPYLAGEAARDAVTVSFLPGEFSTDHGEFLEFVEKNYRTDIPFTTLLTGYDLVSLLNEAIRRGGSARREDVVQALSEIAAKGDEKGAILDRNGDMRPRAVFLSPRGSKWDLVTSQ